MDILNSHALVYSAEQLIPHPNFLRDRYFPTFDMEDIFSTDDVIVEFMDGKRIAAPFVAPRKGGVAIQRKGHTISQYTPPNVAPKRLLMIDDLNKRGFGEALYTRLTPEQREIAITFKDMKELEKTISTREEVMASEMLLNNKLVMVHIADDGSKGEEYELQFYSGSNPNTINLTKKWNESGADILGDLRKIVRRMSAKGVAATDLICSPDVADVVIEDAKIKDYFDNRRYELGTIKPEELEPGVARAGYLNVDGRLIAIYSYAATYTNDEGEDVQFIKPKFAVITAPGCGKTLYGAVTQIEEEDNRFHTRAMKRVPKIVTNASSNVRELYLTSRPLPIPKSLLGWTAFQALV